MTMAHRATISIISTASEVFLIFTTQLYQYFSVAFLFALFGDGPKVFFPKYSQTAILHAPHFWWVVKTSQHKALVMQIMWCYKAKPEGSSIQLERFSYS